MNIHTHTYTAELAKGEIVVIQRNMRVCVGTGIVFLFFFSLQKKKNSWNQHERSEGWNNGWEKQQPLCQECDVHYWDESKLVPTHEHANNTDNFQH